MPRLVALLLLIAAAVPLSASARPHAAASVASSSTKVHFDRTVVGSSSEQLVTISNDNAVTVTLGPAGITKPDAFGLSGGTCFGAGEIVDLAAGASCTIGVTFAPLSTGMSKGELVVHIASAEIGLDDTITVRLSGQGTSS